MLICQITIEHRKWICPLVFLFLFACFIVILCMMHANKVFAFFYILQDGTLNVISVSHLLGSHFL